MALSKNAQILKFFVERAGQAGAGRTRLLKLMYMADYESRKLIGHPVSTLEYWFYHHGPFDSDFYSAESELRGGGYAEAEAINLGSGYVEKRLIDRSREAEFDLTATEKDILSYVANQYMKLELNNLKEVVYATEPMVAVKDKRGDKLPMEQMNGVDAASIPFGFERVVEAERATLNGDYVLADDLFRTLRAKILV